VSRIQEISVAEARRLQQTGLRMIDVREPDEHALGLPEGALAVPRAVLEADPAASIADKAEPILLICAGGRRSLLAAESLAAQGYAELYSVSGGFNRWQAAGLPVSSNEDSDFLQRYSRHLRLPQVGLDGQKKLQRARGLVVGPPA